MSTYSRSLEPSVRSTRRRNNNRKPKPLSSSLPSGVSPQELLVVGCRKPSTISLSPRETAASACPAKKSSENSLSSYPLSSWSSSSSSTFASAPSSPSHSLKPKASTFPESSSADRALATLLFPEIKHQKQKASPVAIPRPSFEEEEILLSGVAPVSGSSRYAPELKKISPSSSNIQKRGSSSSHPAPRASSITIVSMPTATKLTPVDTSTPNYTVSPRPTRLRHCATKAKPKKDWPLVPPFPSKNGPSDVANVDQSESPATVTPHLSQQATIPCPHALQMHSAKRSRLSRSQYTPETDPSVPSLSQALVPSRSASPWTSPSPPPCSGYSPRDPRLRRLNSPVLPAETPDDQAQEVQATFKIPAIHIRQRDVLQLTLVHPREERCAHDIDRIIRLMEAHLSLDVRIARDVWYLEHRKGQSAILWFQLQGIKEKRQLSDSPSPQPSISSAVPSGATTTSSTLLAHNYLGSLPQQVLSDVSPFQFQCAPTLSLQWSIALGLAVGSHLPRSATKHGLVKLIQGVRFEGNKQHDLTFSLTEQELRCHLHAPSLYVLAYSATTNAPPPLDCVQDQETVMSSLLAHAGPHESIARKPRKRGSSSDDHGYCSDLSDTEYSRVPMDQSSVGTSLSSNPTQSIPRHEQVSHSSLANITVQPYQLNPVKVEVEDDWVPQAFGRFFGANTAPPRPNIVISPNTRTTVSPQKHPSLEISREMVDIIVKELKLSTPTGSKTQSQLTVEQAYQEHLQPRDDLAKQSTGVQTEEFGGVPVSVQDKAILQLIPDLTTMSNLIRNSRQSIDLEESDEEDGGSMIVRSIM